MAIFESTLKPKLIYVFTIPDEKHKGCLKIGETTLLDGSKAMDAPNSPELNQSAKVRIDQYTKTAAVDYQLLYADEGEQANQDGENHQAGFCAGAEVVNVVQSAAASLSLVASKSFTLAQNFGLEFF